MTPVGFLTRVMPQADGKLWFSAIVQSTKTGPNGPEKFMWGEAFRTHEELIQFAMRQTQQKSEVYFTCAAQHVAVEATSRAGRAYHKPQRVAHNCVGFKSLWMDIDLKGAGTYEEQATAAVMSLVEMCAKNAIPRPTILVRSGNGLHVYWTFTAPVEGSVWKQMAESLKQVALNHGLVGFDPVCTADAARILRVPGTFNWKDPAQGKPVQVLKAAADDLDAGEMAEALAPYFVMPSPSTPLPAGFGDLTAGLVVEARPVDFAAVLPSCEVLRHAVETGGADFEEPLWYQTLRAATYSDNPEMWATALSKGHPGYNEADTAKKLDYATQQKSTGWPKCATFSQHRPSMCARCPKFQQNKSPLNHRALIVNGKPVSNDELPSPYQRNDAGLVVVPILNKGADGEVESHALVEIWNYAVHSGTLMEIQGKLHMCFKAEVPKTTAGSKTLTIQIPVEVLNENRDVMKALARCHATCSIEYKDRLSRFIMAWKQKLQAETDVIKRPAYGWSEANGKIEGFSYGGYCHSKADPLPTAQPERSIKAGYEPCGTLDVWKTAAKGLTDQRRPAADALLASAFASPLARMTGLPGGLVLSFCSLGSGTGKSTAMQVAQAVWGHPVTQMTILTDTTASVANKMGAIRSLPLYWDELRGDEATQRFAQLVFQVTQGKEKARLSSSIEQRHVGTWQTMLICAANASVLERVAQASGEGPAGFYRVLEIEMPKVASGGHTFVTVANSVAKLKDNFGHAGLIYSSFLGSNADRAQKFVIETAERIIKRIGEAPAERFWVFSAACLLVGATFANELGLTEIDLQGLEDLLCEDTIPRLRDILAQGEMGVTSASNGDDEAELVRGFIHDCQAKGTFMMTDKAPKRGPKSADHVVMILSPSDPRMLRTINCQFIKEADTLIVRNKALSEFVQSRIGSSYGKIKEIVSKFNGHRAQVKLGAQTLYESAATDKVFSFNTAADVRLREMLE